MLPDEWHEPQEYWFTTTSDIQQRPIWMITRDKLKHSSCINVEIQKNTPPTEQKQHVLNVFSKSLFYCDQDNSVIFFWDRFQIKLFCPALSPVVLVLWALLEHSLCCLVGDSLDEKKSGVTDDKGHELDSHPDKPMLLFSLKSLINSIPGSLWEEIRAACWDAVPLFLSFSLTNM